MSSSIGGQDFDMMHGGPPADTTLELDIWRVPGMDGYGVQTLGLGNGEATITTIAFIDNIDDAITFVLGCADLGGTIQTIIDDWNTTFANVLIVSVDQANCYQPCIYQGSDQVRVQLVWKVLSLV
jgi:hypothetical protein